MSTRKRNLKTVGRTGHGRERLPAELSHEGVEGGKVHGAARTLRGWVLLNGLIGPDEAREDEEIAHRVGDVRLGLAIVMPPQYLGGGMGDRGSL